RSRRLPLRHSDSDRFTRYDRHRGCLGCRKRCATHGDGGCSGRVRGRDRRRRARRSGLRRPRKGSEGTSDGRAENQHGTVTAIDLIFNPLSRLGLSHPNWVRKAETRPWRCALEGGEMNSTPDGLFVSADGEEVQPLRERDATALNDPSDDPAQAEWERTEALDNGASEADLDAATATGRDPGEIPDADDEIPYEDLHGTDAQPETQSADPAIADLGVEGEGDLAPEDI